MWPLDRRCDVMRIGRESVERWSRSPRGLVFRTRKPVDGAPDPLAMSAALRALLREASRSFDAIVESAWLPVLPLDLGESLWSRKQAQALLRHRIERLHARRDEPVDEWTLQLEHRAGERRALGYALAPSVRKSLAAAAGGAGRRMASLQPAFAWARRSLARELRHGWWLWLEQDRSLVCRAEGGKVLALNAGAPLPHGKAHGLRLIEVEASRHHTPCKGQAAIAGWFASVDPMDAADLPRLGVAAPEPLHGSEEVPAQQGSTA